MKKCLCFVALAGLLLTSCDFASRVQAEVYATALLLEVEDPLGVNDPETGLLVRLGTIQDAASDNPKVEPLSGAEVWVVDDSSTFGRVDLTPADESEVDGDATGAYTATSQDTDLSYTPGERYHLTIRIPSGDYKGEYAMSVTAAEAAEVSGYPDALQGDTHPVGQPLTVTVEPPDEYEYGLVAVLEDTGDEPELVYDNRPDALGEWLEFLNGTFGGEIEVPGEAFSKDGTVYGVAVSGLVSSRAAEESSGLNLLSEFLAGSSTPALVCTEPQCSL